MTSNRITPYWGWRFIFATVAIVAISFAAPIAAQAKASTASTVTKHKHKDKRKYKHTHRYASAPNKRGVATRSKVKVTNALLQTTPSLAQSTGLHRIPDILGLRSSVALVIDQQTNETLFEKNANVVLPIASITKLMTALVVTDAHQPMDEILTVSNEDRDTEKGSRSRLRTGLQLTRGEFLLLALMASENRAAFTLSSNYPGGREAFVTAMNRKAQELHMADTYFADPTGLTRRNVSSPADLVKLVNAAYAEPLIRSFSTQPMHEAYVAGRRPLHYVNSNRLVRAGQWEIGLQKTGYISEAGRCLVMQAKVQDRPVIMIFLDSTGKVARFADAQRVRHWLEEKPWGMGKL
ncbi:MAG: serine hydrolase [Ottowia sp.]|nr:serine hydrolase [Ottowia sp.]